MRALSGIQPSGAVHIGNYFGAIKQYVALQQEHEGFYFIANYHALTSIRDAATLRRYCLDLATDLLALGIDPDRATLFMQSDIPEVTELTWLLSAVTPMGLLERCVAYKEKVAEGIPADHGLFAYPVLQAADILIYNSDLVPVGQDQKQHVEVTRDIATKFNSTFGEVFKLPEAHILADVAVVNGTDGRKMSKSYGNAILIFEEPDELKRQVMSVKTDSRSVEEPKDPESCNVYNLYKLFAADEDREAVADRYRKGDIGYAEAKQKLLAAIIEYFAPQRQRRTELEADPDYVRDVLKAGAEKARAEARETLDRARSAVGA